MSDKVSTFWFSDVLSSTQQLHQRSSRAQLQKDIDISGIFESKIELHNVLVIHLLMDLDLLSQLKLELLIKTSYQ